MMPKFYKNKPYTLCLLKYNKDFDDVSTWCANVTYKGLAENHLHVFVETDTRYYVDTSAKTVSVEHDEVCNIGFNFDTGECEFDITPTIDFVGLANIVKGWQY